LVRKAPAALKYPPDLLNIPDSGEAAVIQLALDQNIETVAIDEAAGRGRQFLMQIICY
jgi:predicted nucleic acid-binding protein